MWADSVLRETMEDALKALNTANENAVACEYLSFMDEESIKVLDLSVEKNDLNNILEKIDVEPLDQ